MAHQGRTPPRKQEEVPSEKHNAEQHGARTPPNRITMASVQSLRRVGSPCLKLEVECEEPCRPMRPESLRLVPQSPRFGMGVSRASPNPSIERTANGGAHCHAPSLSVAPSAAAHVKR